MMITTTALTKRYRSARVVSDVSLRCEPGTGTGFLGPNGAGQSTTLTVVVGLARSDRGSSTVGGHPFVDLPTPTRVVGTLLDPAPVPTTQTGR
jgi:ABC-2 type transport system ATP-binding protein